jgi:hypothetical protein
MAFNIQSFADNIGRYGTAPVNRFEVRIPVPLELIFSNALPIGDRIMSFRAEKVNIPGIVLDSYESRRYGVGPSIKTPTSISRFNEISIDFIDTSKLEIKAFFHRWLNYIVETAGNNGGAPTFLAAYKAEYSIDMEIRVYNQTSLTPIYIQEVVQAFPTAITDSSMSWSRTNEFFRTSVVFSYKHHRQITGTAQTTPPAQATANRVLPGSEGE